MTDTIRIGRNYKVRPQTWHSGVDITVVDQSAKNVGGIRTAARSMPDIGFRLLSQPTEFFHRVSVQGSSEFHDYETFGSDEHGTFPFLSQTVLSTHGPSMTLLTWRRGFGGEERVEIDVTGSLNSTTGVLIASMNVRFYEGATEGTTELEDSDIWNAAIPVNATGNFDIFLANDEDDWARVIGSVSNQRI